MPDEIEPLEGAVFFRRGQANQRERRPGLHAHALRPRTQPRRKRAEKIQPHLGLRHGLQRGTNYPYAQQPKYLKNKFYKHLNGGIEPSHYIVILNLYG